MKPPLSLPYPAALFLSLVSVLAGCAGPGESPRAAEQPSLRPAPASLPASKVATVTIYHPEFDDGAGSSTVSINGTDVVSPSVGTVFTTRLLPGTYRFELDGSRAGELKAAAGQKYFFQLATVPNPYGGGNPRLGIVSPQQAKDETARLQPIDKDEIDAAAFR